MNKIIGRYQSCIVPENARWMLLYPKVAVSALFCQIDIINLDKSPSGGLLNESFAGTRG